jgi:hypothetical protein
MCSIGLSSCAILRNPLQIQGWERRPHGAKLAENAPSVNRIDALRATIYVTLHKNGAIYLVENLRVEENPKS